MSEHFVITLRISGRTYRLRIRRKDEQVYRNAVDAIEKKISQYRSSFSGPDHKALEEQDYLIMTTIQALSEYVDLEMKNAMFEDKIKALTNELEEYLRK